jgi:type IV fimbrial biogenesis protein FimT
MSMHGSQGLTLVELLIVLAVAAILAALAAPSFTDQFARRRLEGVATELSTDLQFARTQAVANGGVVRVMTLSTTQYVVRNAANTDLKTVNLSSGITATNGVTVAYEPLRGMATVTNGPIDLTSTQTAAQVRLDVNPMGRVNLCTPGGSLKGYATC